MLLLSACDSAVRERHEPSFIDVRLGTFDVGSQEAPLAFSSTAASLPLSLTTLDVDGQAYPFDGTLKVRARPGQIDGDATITVTGGAWSGDIPVKNGFGPTRVWFTDEDETDGRTPGWSAGISPVIWWEQPTIAEFQFTDDTETNQLEGEYVEVRVDDRQVVVTAIDAAGFWVTDLLDGTGTFNSLYIYTFQKPADEIVEGAQLVLLNGGDQEYLASTQFSWPTYEVGESTLAVPDAVELDEDTACDDLLMEALEGSRLIARDVSIPGDFTVDSEAFTDFEEYGQWPVALGSCMIYAESGSTVPDFYPPDHAGESFDSVSGMLKEVYGKWILTVLGSEDLLQDGQAVARTP
jgi:hypothetical protein